METTHTPALQEEKNQSGAILYQDSQVFQSVKSDDGKRPNTTTGESRHEQYSKLKSLLKAPSKAQMSSVASPPGPTPRRWSTAEVVSPTKESQQDKHSPLDKNVVNSEQHHEQKKTVADDSIDMQMFPLDLSCKNPQQRADEQSHNHPLPIRALDKHEQHPIGVYDKHQQHLIGAQDKHQHPIGVHDKHHQHPIGAQAEHQQHPIGTQDKHQQHPIGVLDKHQQQPTGVHDNQQQHPMGAQDKHQHLIGVHDKHQQHPIGAQAEHQQHPIGLQDKQQQHPIGVLDKHQQQPTGVHDNQRQHPMGAQDKHQHLIGVHDKHHQHQIGVLDIRQRHPMGVNDNQRQHQMGVQDNQLQHPIGVQDKHQLPVGVHDNQRQQPIGVQDKQRQHPIGVQDNHQPHPIGVQDNHQHLIRAQNNQRHPKDTKNKHPHSTSVPNINPYPISGQGNHSCPSDGLNIKSPRHQTHEQNNQPQSSLHQQNAVAKEEVDEGQTLHGDSILRRSSCSSDGMPELEPSPAPIAASKQKQVKQSAPFDPLFILSQVACEKLSELQSTEPEQKSSGKGKVRVRSKRNKKGQNGKGTRKFKKKGHSKTIESDGITIERVENGKPISVDSYSGRNVYNERQNGYLNQYAKYREQTDAGLNVKMMPSYKPHTPDVVELNSDKKQVGGVSNDKKVDGQIDKSTWPYTCRTCATRFKNAAFLRIHEKIAHENKLARTDNAGNHVKYVAKDGAPESSQNSTPRNPFPIPHWKSSSGDQTDGQQNQQGYTAIPCILKVHRQTSTSEMSSSLVKMEGDIMMEDGQFQGKFEPAEIFRAAENGEFDSHHPRPKLEVDGSSYEIVKVERDKSAPSGDPGASSPSSSKGYQHKFYLQISDRNQSGSVDSTVKIERGTTQIPLEDFDDVDDKSELKRRLLEGNPNQIRVPTSLALKFIPGDSGDSERQPGYQHKVYLRIMDGNESSIKIKTGSMASPSPNMVGSTAVKIESRFHEHPRRQLYVNDTTRPHKCHYCPKHFPSISALTAHERIHTGEKPYECRFCGRAFYHQNDRRKHERIHTGEKPYQCSICGQKFTNKGQVKIHERNHTGERPYQCRHCHKCFKSISNVNRHEKIHTGLKPYTCPVCHRGFSRREHVRTHEEICRKKLIEDEEELADDPIGDVKLPYFRQIGIKPDAESPIEGSPPFSDQPPDKRPKFDDEEDDEERDYQDRDEWSGKETTKEFDDSRSFSHIENIYRKYEDIRDDEDTSSNGKDSDKQFPLLYNSGPPVKPEEVSSSSMIDTHVHGKGDPMRALAETAIKNSEVKPSTESESLGAYNYKPAGGDGFLPIGYDQNKPPIHVSYDPVNNRAKMPPPVLYVPGSGDSNDAQTSNDKPPLLYLSVPKKAPTVTLKRKPTDPSKLSSHIEALDPIPDQPTVHTPDIPPKEPRHYVCGPQTNTTPVIQKESIQDAKSTSKLSESIPETDRLLKPTVHSRTSTSAHRAPVTEMYSNLERQEPVSIVMKTLVGGSSPMSGGENPPVLCPQNTTGSKVHKPVMDGPPVLSVANEGPSKAVQSPVNAIPPLLERHERPLIVDAEKNERLIVQNQDQKHDRPVFDIRKNDMTDISQPFSIVHSQSSSAPNESQVMSC